jgi:hypothetical protein
VQAVETVGQVHTMLEQGTGMLTLVFGIFTPSVGV